MAFESDFVHNDRRSSVIVPLYKGKGENVRTIEVLVRVGKLKNGKDEVTGEMTKGWCTGFEGCVIGALRVVLCRKTGDLL